MPASDRSRSPHKRKRDRSTSRRRYSSRYRDRSRDRSRDRYYRDDHYRRRDHSRDRRDDRRHHTDQVDVRRINDRSYLANQAEQRRLKAQQWAQQKEIERIQQHRQSTPEDQEEEYELKAPPTRAKPEEDDDNDYAVAAPVETVEEDSTVDPLDAYMHDINEQVKKVKSEDMARVDEFQGTTEFSKEYLVSDEGEEEAEEVHKTPEEYLASLLSYTFILIQTLCRLASAKGKKKELVQVDHAKMEYEEFVRDFYVEPPELADLTPQEVDLLRAELENIKIAGRRCPKPVKKWSQCGLPRPVLDVVRKLGFAKPTPIQSQALPAIMSGRDVIGIAKTGSGKTLAFLLPMFRHVMAQRSLENGEGPIALIMTPTRELAVQIHKECRHFLKSVNLRAICAYGGAPIKDQIAEFKRGAEIAVCTPGRMIDLLCANGGRVVNLQRVTYLVLDESDRMFDMGFEPQVMKIIGNVRPDRQSVLFSATFPRQMEALARKILYRPVEIIVGGRSVVCDDVNQIVEVREESTKFLRLLEILGQQYNDDDETKSLIFVDRQEAADTLARNLTTRGYVCAAIHGGKEQANRDTIIQNFKGGNTQILIATSVASRGLDVKQLGLVVNYECPNHMEDYVHRVGRTGRAGNKGTAYTFVTPLQEKYALDIMKALKLSGVPVPSDLETLANGFLRKVKSGQASYSGSGFGGKGLDKLDKERDVQRKQQKQHFNATEGVEEEDEESGGEVEKGDAVTVPEHVRLQGAAGDYVTKHKADIGNRLIQAQSVVNARVGSAGSTSFEFEINDYPQKARWQVTRREQLSAIVEASGASVTTKGVYIPPGKTTPAGQRKLYLHVQSESDAALQLARKEIMRILKEAVLESSAAAPAAARGRYDVV